MRDLLSASANARRAASIRTSLRSRATHGSPAIAGLPRSASRPFNKRGEGTDFKQLAEYRTGDAVRHIDWKATLRFEKPIVRQFQNERDQCVMLLIDCGRRMRADDRQGGIGTAHFDQVLNAVMLLTYVALKQGDAVGAMTFGTPPGEERWFAPRKGAARSML